MARRGPRSETYKGEGAEYSYFHSTGSIKADSSIIATGSIQSQSLGVPMLNIGSPSSVGNFLIQAGSDATGTGSEKNFDFPTAFSAVPVVMATHGETEEDILVYNQSTSGAVVRTTSASQDFFWIAVGAK